MIESLGYWYQRLIAGPFTRGRIKSESERCKADLLAFVAEHPAFAATDPAGYRAVSPFGPN